MALPAAESAPARGAEALPAAVSGSPALRRALEGLGRPPRAAGSPAADVVHPDGPGSELERFWAWDFRRSEYYPVQAELRHVSPTCAIYSELGSGVGDRAVGRLAGAFEDTIYPVLRRDLATEPSPGIDGRTAVTILLLDVRDDLYHDAPPFRFVGGYFDPANQWFQADHDARGTGRRSNEREMIYIDIEPTDSESVELLQTTAHEFAHLIGWFWDPSEEDWLAETISQLAVHLAGRGHPVAQLSAFLERPDAPLDTWRGEVADYGRAYAFGLYLFEQLGGHESGVARKLTRHPGRGVESVALMLPPDRGIDELYRDFALALRVDSPPESGTGRFGFVALNLSPGALPVDAPEAFPPAAMRSHPLDPTADTSTLALLAPWSARADAFPLLADGNGDLGIVTSGPACVGAALTSEDGSDRSLLWFETTCTGDGTEEWRLDVDPGWSRGPGDPSRTLISVVTHSGDGALSVEIFRDPVVGAMNHLARVLFPIALLR